MAQHWQEMLPIDRYEVAVNGLLFEYDRKVLSLLYQPLIGPVAYSVYMTLWAQVEDNRLTSDGNSHHVLMNGTSLNLKEIYEARLRLEGIGLLTTYVRTQDEVREFIYELMPPLTPAQFFKDGMLNIFLYRKIGKSHFLKLKNFFSDESLTDRPGYQNVTRSFQEVYDTAVPANMDAETREDLEQEVGQVFFDRGEPNSLQITEESFDFDLFFAGLSEALVPKRSITKRVREAITKLAFLYGIDPIQMKNLVISASDENSQIQIDELRKGARDWYQLHYSEHLPQLVDKTQPPLKTTIQSQPKTQEEKLIYYLETTSPRQLLIDISGGGEPAKADLQIIEHVLFQQKLLPGVVNVLIHYVLLKTDMRLTKNYVDKIASHWSRKQISTVAEAMELAKKEHRQYLEWQDGKQTAKTATKKKAIRTESLPEWFDQKEAGKETKKESPQSPELEAKQKALEERLKKYKQ